MSRPPTTKRALGGAWRRLAALGNARVVMLWQSSVLWGALTRSSGQMLSILTWGQSWVALRAVGTCALYFRFRSVYVCVTGVRL